MQVDCINRQHKTTKSSDRAQPSVESKIVDGCLDLFHPPPTPLIRLAARLCPYGPAICRRAIGRNSGTAAAVAAAATAAAGRQHLSTDWRLAVSRAVARVSEQLAHCTRFFLLIIGCVSRQRLINVAAELVRALFFIVDRPNNNPNN